MRVSLLIGIAALSSASLAGAAVKVAEWNYNAGSAGIPNPSFGTGSSSAYKMPGATAGNMAVTTAGNGFGSNIDTSVAQSLNNAGGFLAFGAPGTDNGLRGVRWNTSTQSKTDISIKFDLLIQRRASRHWQLMFTADNGTTWSAPTGGTATVAQAVANTTSATISASGRISVVSNNPTTASNSVTTGMPASYNTFSFNLPAGSVYENNPNFGFALMSVWDVAKNDFVSTNSGQTNAESSTDGYLASGAGGTGIRVDLVTISGVPEPTSLAALSGAMLVLRRRR